MDKEQVLQTNLDEFSRCEEQGQMTDHGKSLSPIQKTDAVIKGYINQALWKDNVLRAMDYYEIDVHVKNGTVYLNGHIVSTTSQNRIKNAIRAIPGILGIKNNLVLDDKLTLEVATSLGKLEHTYDCKFFTGASHGVIYLSGIVSDENVKLLAEKCAASNPNVRGVINNVRVSGVELQVQNQLFLQPTIGEILYFMDGISGVVKQVIINPNNRRVIAMTIQGHSYDMQQNLTLWNNSAVQLAGQLLVIPMSVMGHLTKSSGFLTIQSTDSTKYQKFDASLFSAPKKDWIPPHPYCPDNVLFPVEYQPQIDQIANDPHRSPSKLNLEYQLFSEELLANDSLGG
jgi:osmotically-inducible protein OsmY